MSPSSTSLANLQLAVADGVPPKSVQIGTPAPGLFVDGGRTSLSPTTTRAMTARATASHILSFFEYALRWRGGIVYKYKMADTRPRVISVARP